MAAIEETDESPIIGDVSILTWRGDYAFPKVVSNRKKKRES